MHITAVQEIKLYVSCVVFMHKCILIINIIRSTIHTYKVRVTRKKDSSMMWRASRVFICLDFWSTLKGCQDEIIKYVYTWMTLSLRCFRWRHLSIDYLCVCWCAYRSDQYHTITKYVDGYHWLSYRWRKTGTQRSKERRWEQNKLTATSTIILNDSNLNRYWYRLWQMVATISIYACISQRNNMTGHLQMHIYFMITAAKSECAWLAKTEEKRGRERERERDNTVNRMMYETGKTKQKHKSEYTNNYKHGCWLRVYFWRESWAMYYFFLLLCAGMVRATALVYTCHCLWWLMFKRRQESVSYLPCMKLARQWMSWLTALNLITTITKVIHIRNNNNNNNNSSANISINETICNVNIIYREYNHWIYIYMFCLFLLLYLFIFPFIFSRSSFIRHFFFFHFILVVCKSLLVVKMSEKVKILNLWLFFFYNQFAQFFLPFLSVDVDNG